MFFLSAILLSLPFILAHPLFERRASALCGQYDSVESGSYALLTNHWGEDNASSGSQCSLLESVQNNRAQWYTKWTWTGGTGIKSFSNIQLNAGLDQRLDAISGMPSIWHWSHEHTDNVVADVAYDLFTSYTAGGSRVHEIMIWLGNFNAKPISYEYSYDGQALAVDNGLSIGDYTWDLYMGSNGYNIVYSFLPVDGNVNSFSGDLYRFFTYLIDHNYIDSSEYLVTAQGGTEATSGSALFKTSVYSLSIN